jgi:hypothetical protein
VEILDTVEAHQLEPDDVVIYVTRKGEHLITVKSVNDLGTTVEITGYSHETGDNITKTFEPDDLFDIMGA